MKPNFGKSFFEKHQSKLVRFANSWIGRKFFDFKGGFGLEKVRVMALFPNAVSYDWKVKDGKLVKTTCFSTDNHYQKKLEHAYRFLMMFVPQAVAWKMLQPSGALMLPLVALTTSTFYPDANPESTSVDGYVGYNVSNNWSTTRDAPIGAYADHTSGDTWLCSASYNTRLQNYYIDRGFLLFDTSSIGSSDEVDSANLVIYSHVGVITDTDDFDIDIVSSNPASNTAIVTGDYDKIGSTVFASMSISSWDTDDGDQNTFSLNASGLSNINTTGVSKFAVRCSGDTDDITPTGFNRVECYYADYGSNKPKLVVVHSVATSIKTINDLAKASVKTVNDLAIANVKSINDLI
jgi:hypothetical protein